MFALNFGAIYLFECLDLVEGMNVMKEVKWLHMNKKNSCLKYSNLVLKIHQQTLQYQITFQMMKTMHVTHKGIINKYV